MSLSSSLLFGKKPLTTINTSPAKLSLEDIQISLEKVVAQQGSVATIDISLYINHVQYLLTKVSCLKDYEKQERLEKEQAEYELQSTTDAYKEKTQQMKRRIADLEQQQQLSSKRQRLSNVMKATGSIGGVKVTDPDFWIKKL